MRILVLAIVVVLIGSVFSGVKAQTADTCLAINNARYSETISVTVTGYPGTFWSFRYGEWRVLRTPLPEGRTLRGANFTIQLYKGDNGNRGTGMEGGNRYTIWTYLRPVDEKLQRAPDCKSGGAWFVTVHE